MEKGLYQAPQGEGIAIEIDNPDAVHIEMDGLEIDLEPAQETAEDFGANLAEYLPEGYLSSLAGDLIDDFGKDQRDRRDWIETYVQGLKLLGLKYEERTEPWQGACGVFHPMLTESVVRFQAEGIMETFPAAGPVKASIIGKETPEISAAAQRVQTDMKDRKSTRLNSSHVSESRMPSSA